MLDNKAIIKVSNREEFTVGYKIPELDVRRQFQPKESKEITMGELRKLSYVPGGQALLEDYLILRNEEAVAELLGDVEPEYYYGLEDIKRLLVEAPLEELQDCLDFAPAGVVEQVKDLAVKLKINDVSKRDAIKDILGFDVTKAIEINAETARDAAKVAPKKRRTHASPIMDIEPAPAEPEKKRRVAPPKYNVVR